MPERIRNHAPDAPLDDVSGEQLPPRFAEALTKLRAAMRQCENAGIPGNTLISAMMAEAMPRLVEAYGHSGAALALAELSREISATGQPPPAIQ